MNHVVDVEKSSRSSGSINKDKKYKLNKNKYKFSPERQSCSNNNISLVLAQQKVVVANITIPLNSKNKFNNERKNTTTTTMKKEKSHSVQCLTDDNIESNLSKIPNTVNQYDQNQDNNTSPPLINVANTERIKLYNNIKDVGIETIPAKGKKSALVLNSERDKDKVHNIYISIALGTVNQHQRSNV